MKKKVMLVGLLVILLIIACLRTAQASSATVFVDKEYKHIGMGIYSQLSGCIDVNIDYNYILEDFLKYKRARQEQGDIRTNDKLDKSDLLIFVDVIYAETNNWKTVYDTKVTVFDSSTKECVYEDISRGKNVHETVITHIRGLVSALKKPLEIVKTSGKYIYLKTDFCVSGNTYVEGNGQEYRIKHIYKEGNGNIILIGKNKNITENTVLTLKNPYV